MKFTKSIKHLDMHRAVTVWTAPGEKLLSQWGHITYEEWCLKECRRMNECGGDVLVCQEPEGQIAICRP